MVWRLYYTLEAAAEELSKEFDDTYTANDLIHYAAIGLVELHINGVGKKYCFAKRPFCDFKYPENKKNMFAELPEASIYHGHFIPLTVFQAMQLEGGKEYLEIDMVDKLSLIDENMESVEFYAESPTEQKDLEKWVFCLIPNELLEKLAIDWVAKREDIDKQGNVISASKADLCILQDDLEALKVELIDKIKSKKVKEVDDRKSLFNIISALKELVIDKGIKKNQAEIIDYLVNEAEGYGLSEASLKAKFAEANKLKKSN